MDGGFGNLYVTRWNVYTFQLQVASWKVASCKLESCKLNNKLQRSVITMNNAVRQITMNYH